ncbi:hypothetical protein KCV07_g7451, partial [Aureobasidium melanogenum]
MRAKTLQIQEYVDACREEFDLEDSGRAEDCLAEAFKLLKQYKKPISMGLMASTHEVPIGFTRGGTYGWNYQLKSTFRILLTAAQRSQCSINKFYCRISDVNFDFKAAEESSPDIDMVEIARGVDIFTDTQCIKLDIYSHVPQFIAGLCAVVESAKNISELGLRYSVDGYEIYNAKASCQTTEAVFSSLCSGNLQRITLRSLVSKPKLLKEFLIEHRSTLKEVSFDAVTLVGTWDELLEWIRNNLCLQKLSLSSMCRMDASEFEDDTLEHSAEDWYDYRAPNFLWNGPENIRLGLDQLLKNKRKKYEEHGQGEL